MKEIFVDAIKAFNQLSSLEGRVSWWADLIRWALKRSLDVGNGKVIETQSFWPGRRKAVWPELPFRAPWQGIAGYL